MYIAVHTRKRVVFIRRLIEKKALLFTRVVAA